MALIAAVLLVVAVASGIPLARPSPTPNLAAQATATDQPRHADVPSVIGLTRADAERALLAAGYELVVRPKENPQPNDAVMRQVPPAGWADMPSTEVRVSFLGANDDLQTLPAELARRAIGLAQAAIERATSTPGIVAQLQSTTEVEKDVPCVPTDCMFVRFNVGTRGGNVAIDLARAEPVVDLSWQTVPYGPEPLYTDEELVEAAMSNRELIAALAGRPHSAGVLSGGAKRGAPCETASGIPVCFTITVQVTGSHTIGLVAVNYLTKETRLDRAP